MSSSISFAKKFFKLSNYTARFKKFRKKTKIYFILNKKVRVTNLFFVWKIKYKNEDQMTFLAENKYSIFGKDINLEEKLDWHKDSFSNFIYPLKRFDKINASQWFNKGIELVYPWELSRFYFSINLIQKYLETKDEKYFIVFQNQVEDWIDKNSFLVGVNWISTMDVAIRAVNWIVGFNLIGKELNFTEKIKKSLTQHADYICAFPLIERKGLTTNHTTSAYTGLLFLALSLRDHVKSDYWIKVSLNGLEKCMEDQVYNDGVDFEGSIPYHRLVLELFAYSTILAIANNLSFSGNFYNKLFKMFEFSAAYIDNNGNAPQIGDNDSGRLLIFNSLNNNPYLNEEDHSYLLNLGEYIFDYNFISECTKKDKIIEKYLPSIKKINLAEKKITPRSFGELKKFENSKIYFLKNHTFSICVYCSPSGQNGKGGHNHLDVGSFTLSINGKQVIVDPGSFCYSPSKLERDKFRSYSYHNTIYTHVDDQINFNENGYWDLKEYYSAELLQFNDKVIEVKVKFKNDAKYRIRKFEIFESKILITDMYDGIFNSRINLAPELDKTSINNKEVIIGDKIKIIHTGQNNKIKIDDYEYSHFYGNKIASKNVIVESINYLQTEIVLG
jgi:hypothetical protein